MPPAFPEPVPAVAVGVVRFDGSGGCTFEDTINVNGTSFPDRTSLTCSYFVGRDGRGSIEVSFAGEPAPVPLSFVVIDRNELRFIRTDLGVASGVARRQRGRGGD